MKRTLMAIISGLLLTTTTCKVADTFEGDFVLNAQIDFANAEFELVGVNPEP